MIRLAIPLPFEPNEPVRRAVIRDMVAGVIDPNPLLCESSQNTPEAYAARRLRHLGTLLPADAFPGDWPSERPASRPGRTPKGRAAFSRGAGSRRRRSFLFGRP